LQVLELSTLPTTVDEFAHLTDNDARLAVELALGISPIREILRRFGMGVYDLKTRLRDPLFKGMVEDAKRTWNADLNVKERIRLKSAMLTEDSLLSVYNAVHDANNALPAKLDAFKQLARIAEVDTPDKARAGDGSKFTVHINLGDTPVIIEGTTDE
jgi:hypothetical protein